MKTAKYRKRCFDQIEGIVAENKALSAEVDRPGRRPRGRRPRWVLRKSACLISIGD